MKIEESSVELVKESNILKKIELAGRICYNSQNLITDDSYKKFVSKIVASGHGSVIEHSNIIIKYYSTSEAEDAEFVYEWLLARKGATNSHVWITMEKDENDNYFIMMSGNARAWFDFLVKRIDDYLIDSEDHIKNIYKHFHNAYPILFTEDLGEPWTDTDLTLLTEEEAAKINIVHTSYTFKIITSRDISHQIVRHRVLSFSQQSQRYVNFSLEKNDGEITFILPRIKEGEAFNDWKNVCQNIENLYNGFIDDGYPPEVARCILPNCTKTILYATGHYLDWQHFIELRSDSHAQEEIQFISNKIDKEIKKCYID